MNIEQRAQEITDGAKVLGPQTAPEIIAYHEREFEKEQSLVAEARAKFEAGEILEEEMYKGNPLTMMGLHPLMLEAKVFGHTYVTYHAVPVATLKEAPDSLERIFIPSVRELFKAKVIEHLSKEKGAHLEVIGKALPSPPSSKVYLLTAHGFNDIEHHPMDTTSDFAFRTKEAAEAYIPKWREELLTPDDEGDAYYYEDPHDITTALSISVTEVELRAE